MLRKIFSALVPRSLRPSGHLKSLARKRTNARVHRGPFAGMRWMSETESGADYDIPKLLGIYEQELEPTIERACEIGFTLIVDVGAAEGYYAVGLALRNPKARIVAFEMQAKEQADLLEKAQLNSVSDRIEIRGKCDAPDLEAAISDSSRPFVICDTEGHELHLLDPEKVPSLSRAYILVELHEFAVPGISEKIEKWHASTHAITRIWQEDRTPADFPFSSVYTRILPDAYLNWAVGESRPERMSWLWMEPIANG